jgi:hypothetical protein
MFIMSGGRTASSCGPQVCNVSLDFLNLLSNGPQNHFEKSQIVL